MQEDAKETFGKSGSGRTIQCNTVEIRLDPVMGQVELQGQLQVLAKEIVSGLSALGSSQSKELLGSFVSDLFLGVATQSQKEIHRQKQAEGIVAARARGVRIGRRPIQVTDEFMDIAEQWENGQISATAAAGELGMSRDTFLRRAKELCAAGQK